MATIIPLVAKNGVHAPADPVADKLDPRLLALTELLSDDTGNTLALGTDGGLMVPEGSTEGVVSGVDSGVSWFQLGDFLVQVGTGIAPTSNTRTTTTHVSLPKPVGALLHVGVTSRISSIGAFGIGATHAVTGYVPGTAASAFDVVFNSADDGGDTGFQIIAQIPFTWFAIGNVNAPAGGSGGGSGSGGGGGGSGPSGPGTGGGSTQEQ